MGSSLSKIWGKAPEKLLQNASTLTMILQENLKNNSKKIDITNKQIEKATQDIENLYDKKYGGFGNSVKFPNEGYLLFLLNQQQHSFNENRQNIESTKLGVSTNYWRRLSICFHKQ